MISNPIRATPSKPTVHFRLARKRDCGSVHIMWSAIPSTRRIFDFKLSNKAGLYSNTPGATLDSPIVELVVAVLLGTLAGLLVGFIVSGILRYCSMVMGRHIGGAAWTLYMSLLGGLIFGLIAVFREE